MSVPQRHANPGHYGDGSIYSMRKTILSLHVLARRCESQKNRNHQILLVLLASFHSCAIQFCSQVARTTAVVPSKPVDPITTTSANSCAPVEGVLPQNNAHNDGDVNGETAGDSTGDALLDIAGRVQEVAVASTSSLTKIAESIPGLGAGRPTGSVSWQHETFLLPFPATPTLEGDDPDSDRAGGSADGGDGLDTNGAEKDTTGTSDEDDDDDTTDHLGDVQLRVEIWRGTHCLGQVCASAHLGVATLSYLLQHIPTIFGEHFAQSYH